MNVANFKKEMKTKKNQNGIKNVKRMAKNVFDRHFSRLSIFKERINERKSESLKIIHTETQ